MLSSSRSLASLAVGAFLAATMLAAPTFAQGTDPGWPRELDTDSGKVVIYQPQGESLSGITLIARAAAAVIGKGKSTPVFGVVWFTSRAQTDRDARTVSIDQVVVTNARFPGITPEREKRFRDLLNPQLAHWQFTIGLDRFQAGLAEAAAEQRSADSLNTTPPAIIFTDGPAALLLYSGEPLMRPLEKTGFQTAVNSPMLVVLDPSDSSFYLNGGPLWYAAKAALGPWAKVDKVPAAVSKLVPDSIQKDSAPPGNPPRIVVATKPTELFVVQGKPEWTPIAGTELLYVKNTERDVFKDIGTQQTYVLASGRWFTSRTFEGPWTFVRPDSLPKTFAKIPPASDKAPVLASVAGTQEANDAVMDAQIPQTAAIDRATAKVTVTYDGDPKFEPITGTKIRYATNTASQVLLIGARYYVCDQGVWFSSIGPLGPWAVSDSVPQDVQSIPPDSPAYNTKYVQVYQSTPQVVYVGYTPGYMWSYPYYGTVVYGTGYYYPPYVGPVVYYPPPITYGVAIRYNPWTGWTVGFGYSTPFMHVGIVVRPPYYGGWYGPYRRPMYPPPYYRPPYGGYPGYRPGYGGGYPGYRPPAGGYPGGARPAPYGGNNLYRQPSNANRAAPPSAVTRDVQSGKFNGSRPNNVVAGRDGNAYRQNGGSWQQSSGGQWQNAGGGNRGTSAVPSDVNRSMQNREHGQQRTQDYNKARSSGTSHQQSAPRSAPRGGGGRRP